MTIPEEATRATDNTPTPEVPVTPQATPDYANVEQGTPLRILQILRSQPPVKEGAPQPKAPANPTPPTPPESSAPEIAALEPSVPAQTSNPAPVPPLAEPEVTRPQPSAPTFATIQDALGQNQRKATPALNPDIRETVAEPSPVSNTSTIKDDSFVAKPQEVHSLNSKGEEQKSATKNEASAQEIQPNPEQTADADDAEEERSAPRIAAMRTLRDDMKDVVDNKGMSMVRAGTLEEARRHARKSGKRATPEGVRGSGPARQRGGLSRILLASIILLLLGGAALGTFFFYRSLAQGPLEDVQTFPSLIFAEQTITLPLERATGAILRATLGQARTSNAGSPGSILRILPTIAETTSIGQTASEPRVATAREFFSTLGVTLPPELSASLGEEFFLGIQAGDGNQPLLILSVTSYERAFSGMLAWEKTVSEALSPPFTRVPTTVQSADGSLAGNPFTDVVIRNYDVRLLNNPDGTPGLFYAFPNRQLLIITSSPYTLIEALSRLQAARNL